MVIKIELIYGLLTKKKRTGNPVLDFELEK